MVCSYAKLTLFSGYTFLICSYRYQSRNSNAKSAKTILFPVTRTHTISNVMNTPNIMLTFVSCKVKKKIKIKKRAFFPLGDLVILCSSWVDYLLRFQ